MNVSGGRSGTQFVDERDTDAIVNDGETGENPESLALIITVNFREVSLTKKSFGTKDDSFSNVETRSNLGVRKATFNRRLLLARFVHRSSFRLSSISIRTSGAAILSNQPDLDSLSCVDPAPAISDQQC